MDYAYRIDVLAAKAKSWRSRLRFDFFDPDPESASILPRYQAAKIFAHRPQ